MSNWQRWKGIMKAYPFEEKRLAKWIPPYIIQPKYDGVRCRAIWTKAGYLLLSSEENIIYSVPHINAELNTLQIQDELDGELYCHGLSFEQIISITSRTVNLHPDREQIKFHIFDIVDERAQSERLISIDNLEHKFNSCLLVAPFWLCNDLEDIMKTYDILLNMDYEGIIVRHHAASYVRKRSIFVMKFKPKKEDTYDIIGWDEEMDKEGNPKGTLGSLQCRSGDGGTFNVGTGFARAERKSFWGIRDTLAGKQVKVQYQHLTSGNKVPRFPVFVEVIGDDI